MTSSYENGRGSPSTRGIPQAFDKIEIFRHSNQGIFEKAAELYRKGHSLRTLARELSLSKTTIRKTLLEGGAELKPGGKNLKGKTLKEARCHIGVAPYGYFVHQGRLEKDTKEQRVVQRIVSLKLKGHSLTAIAEQLNNQRVRPRSGKQWDHSVIRSILQRHQNQ